MTTAGKKIRGMILAYHRIESSEHDAFKMTISVDRFREQLERCRRFLAPVRLEDVWAPARPGALGNLAVTFDDGYANNLEVASPILVELGVPATFFVNSGALDSRAERFWDRLERIFFHEPGHLRDVHATLMRATPAEREAMLASIVERSGGELPSRSALRALSLAELVTLAERPGHSIGSHGENHALLPELGPEERAREIVRDKRRLEMVLDREVSCFAYPFGASDEATRRAVEDSGFRLAVGGAPRAVTDASDRFDLPRIDAASLSPAELERTIVGLFDAN